MFVKIKNAECKVQMKAGNCIYLFILHFEL